ncbi:MAG: single-stranded-DNA-specific exonuclease RecJ [Phycisphaerales bacterium]|nr:single-stranded-DNA-specific exonuclease RecJ [Phycisphaerales bacterium]
MRGLTHRWRTPEALGAVARPGEAALARTLAVEPLVARVLIARGMGLPDDARAFCSPVLMDLSDPVLIPGLDAAANRLLEALERDEHIAIYGDYDVDGVTATAILHHVMTRISPQAKLTNYIPHRLDEGYGINTDAVRDLASGGVQVIVSVDCGITAIEPARAARELGIDLIITDHHNPPSNGALPEAYAIVHPRVGDGAAQDDDAWAHLSGAGVAFQAAWRLASLAAGGGRVAPDMQKLLLDLLALAALGTVADVVPLQGDNRIITRFGLARVRSTSLLGLGALVAESGLVSAEIDAEAAGFQLGPRLNACGRMWHAQDAVELFITQDIDRARTIARRLGELNSERQRLERTIVDAACKEAEAQGMTSGDARAIVLAHPDWHRGIVGIACSRLVNRFHRPTILLQEVDGQCHGSGRSIDGFNLHAALQACAVHLESFGGHDMAAGVCVRTSNLPAFADAMRAHALEHITDSMLTPSLSIDCEATIDELTLEAVRQLTALGPFGRSNPKPRLLLRGVRCVGMPRRMGQHAKHVSFDVAVAGARSMRVVAWHWGEHFETLNRARNGQIDIVVTPSVNVFRGATRIEATLADAALDGVVAAIR